MSRDPTVDDPYDLERFVQAQASGEYETALAEVKGGRKYSHWMWFIFPQIDGLGSSPTAKAFSIKSLDEARAYLAHPVLGPQLLKIAEAAVKIEGRSAREIFGSPDDLKLRSCATLFACACPPSVSGVPGATRSVFERLLAKYYPEGPDAKTLGLLGITGP